MTSLRPSPVMVLTPVLGEAAITSWPPWRRKGMVFEPIKPVPPITTIFIPNLLVRSPPAGVCDDYAASAATAKPRDRGARETEGTTSTGISPAVSNGKCSGAATTEVIVRRPLGHARRIAPGRASTLRLGEGPRGARVFQALAGGLGVTWPQRAHVRFFSEP